MKKISMLIGAAAVVLMSVTPAGAGALEDQGCSGPLTFKTLKVRTNWSPKTLVAGRKATVTVTVSRRGPQRLTGNNLPQTPEIDQPVAGARVMTAIYLSRGYRWAVGETDENGRVTFEIPLPKTKLSGAIAATGAEVAMGPSVDCGVSEVGYAQDLLQIRR